MKLILSILLTILSVNVFGVTFSVTCSDTVTKHSDKSQLGKKRHSLNFILDLDINEGKGRLISGEASYKCTGFTSQSCYHTLKLNDTEIRSSYVISMRKPYKFQSYIQAYIDGRKKFFQLTQGNCVLK
jgi:hypothetical protein